MGSLDISTSNDDVTVVEGPARSSDVAPRPRLVGRYRVLDELGRGGMGTVYLAEDAALGRKVAVKLLHGQSKREAMVRLLREAQAMARLTHPNVVSVFEVGIEAEPPYVVMEYVEGQTLADWLEQPHPWTEVLEVFEAAGRGLAAAHAEGLVHRDFKPSNVIIGTDGRARVLDFGLVTAGGTSAMSAASESWSGEREPDVSDERLTRAGSVVGTPAYMAPEQRMDGHVDARTDQFSFCVALYEGLYGQRPFGGASRDALVKARDGALDPLEEDRGVPARLQRVLMRGLAWESAERWPTMEALLAELRGPERSRVRVASVSVGVLAAATALVVGLTQPEADACPGPEVLAGEVWGEAQVAAVDRAFTDAGLHEHEARQRVHAGLGGYAKALGEATHEVCVQANASEQPETFDARGVCLSARRLRLESLIAVLSQPSPTLVTGGPRAVRSLPPIRECADASAEPGVPDALSEPVASLRRSLARLEALEAASRFDDGVAESVPLLEQARELDYPPVLAETLLRRGRLLAGAGAYDEARGALEEAYLIATEAEHDAVALDAATKLVRVVGHELAMHDEGRTWARHGASLLERTGIGGMPRARFLREEGSLFHSAGQYAQAQQRHEQAIAIMERELGADHPEYADTLLVLGHAHGRQRRLEVSRDLAEQARKVYVEALGPRHPIVAETLNDLGVSSMRLGDFEAAESFHRAALSIRVEALGEDHAITGRSRHNLGSVLLRRGRYADGVASLEQAVAIRQAAYGEVHPDVASSYAWLGVGRVLVGEPEQGLRDVRRAVAMMEESNGPDHPRTASIRLRVALAAVQAGETEAAREAYDKIIESERGREGSRVLARALAGRAVLMIDAGDPEGALELLEEARRVAAPGAHETARAAAILIGQARACAALGREECRDVAIEQLRAVPELYAWDADARDSVFGLVEREQ